MTTAVKKILTKNNCVLERIAGESPAGEPLTIYLLLKEEKLPGLRAALVRQDVDVTQYGVVIAQGDASLRGNGSCYHRITSQSGLIIF